MTKTGTCSRTTVTVRHDYHITVIMVYQIVRGIHVSRPLLLDLFCCQGGASAGYVAAGFDVVGVDIDSQPRYPYRFIRYDAVELLRYGFARYPYPQPIAAVHASPPCQAHSNAQRIQGREHPELIEPIRELLQEMDLPWVIENVPGAPLKDPIELCGTMFGLHTYRHRLFESNVPIPVPEHPEHTAPTVKMGRPVREGEFYHAVGNFSNVPYVRRDLGAPWMNRDGLRECIPPAYAKHVGRALLAAL
jgi:DNA (cytosine-5)-methyltransferase 1